MRHQGPFLLLSSFVVVFVLSSAAWLALSVEPYSGLAPLGSDELRFQVLNAAQVQLSYRLPRGLTWSAVYDRLTRQGWVIRDDDLLIWPELMDDSHTAAVFLRFGWLPLGRRRLTTHRDAIDSQRFVVEIIECAPIALLAPCD
jgi:hypothetical protein